MCSTEGLTFNLCISLNHFMVLENTETETHFLMLGPKFKTSKAWWRKLHSKVSKAFSKSIKRRIPGILWTLVKFIRSSKRRMFCPMFLPFIKPVWSEWIKDGSEDSMRVDIIIEKSIWAPACYFIQVFLTFWYKGNDSSSLRDLELVFMEGFVQVAIQKISPKQVSKNFIKFDWKTVLARRFS